MEHWLVQTNQNEIKIITNWLKDHKSTNTIQQIQATADNLGSFETAFREIHKKVCREAGGTMVTDDTCDDEIESPPCMFQSGRIHFMLDMTPFFRTRGALIQNCYYQILNFRKQFCGKKLIKKNWCNNGRPPII